MVSMTTGPHTPHCLPTWYSDFLSAPSLSHTSFCEHVQCDFKDVLYDYNAIPPHYFTGEDVNAKITRMFHRILMYEWGG